MTSPFHDGAALFERARSPVGTWIKLPTVETVEIMALVGFDFVVLDLEHSTHGMEGLSALIAVATGHGLTPLVRVPDHDRSTIGRILDAGARGLLIPHVDTVEQAESVARAMLFPPRGDRGSGGTGRAGQWGLLPRDEYLRRGDATLCIPQLESAEAIEAAPGILAVDGVDAVFLGAADLALSVGDPGPVPGLLRSALAAARAAGKPCGAAAVDAQRGAEAIEQGYGFVLIGNDGGMLAKAARAMLGDFRARRKAAGDG